MTNSHEVSDEEIDADTSLNEAPIKSDETTPQDANAVTPSSPTTAPPPQRPLPQALPIAPSTGYTSRYDSDIDDASIALSDDEDRSSENPEDSSYFGGSMLDSWISVASDGEGAAAFGVKYSGGGVVNGGDGDLNSSAPASLNASTQRGPRFVPPIRDEVKAVAIRPSSTLYLPSLPLDTLHRLSSFLTAGELTQLGMTTKKMNVRCGEVWKRVWGHCGRCLGEVMMAWATGEHADARELTALYLSNGVPIYPATVDHAYSTVAWRMGLEMQTLAGENEEDNSNSNNDDDNENIDPFYTSRYSNNQESPSYTYVEEKSVFWKGKRGIPLSSSPLTSSAPANLNGFEPRAIALNLPSANNAAGPNLNANAFEARTLNRGRTRRSTLDGLPHPALRQRSAEDRAFRPPRRSSFSYSSPTGYTTHGIAGLGASVSASNIESPKMTLRVHRHLADQHLLNYPSLREDVPSTPMNLNADFFHPHVDTLKPRYEPDMDETLRDVRDEMVRNEQDEDWERHEGWNGEDWDLAGDLGLLPLRRSGASVQDVPMVYPSPAADVSLQSYTLSSPNFDTSDETIKGSNKCRTDIMAKLRVRFASHQRILESTTSISEYNNALLDWWDELLPTTAGIHYYNGQSPVPRTSHLQSFLTTPCPKSLGVVQCEIERVRTSSKKKLFPTYEYRLFIRDVKNDNPEGLEDVPPRKDAVLLVAKNKIKSQNAESNKRGVTNYYLCLPQQRDVESHYRSVNNCKEKSGMEVAQGNAVLGRIQGNFIGTEFQILAPSGKKEGESDRSSSSDEGEEIPTPGRRRASVDTPPKGKNGLARLARRASLTMTRRPSISTRRPSIHSRRPSMTGFRRSPDPTEAEEEPRNNKAYRRLSFTKSRPKRSSVANSELDCPRGEFPVVEEEEIGAITYTANLLGNRPRIMDVCVPKLNDDGTPIRTWKTSPEVEVEDGESGNNRMLNQFKALQQARDARDEAEADGILGLDQPLPSMDDHGLMVLQNRPPWWNVEIGAFVLNFGGRVSVASVKNFQLCERSNQDHIMLQFGRISGRHSFTMDFQYPLTPMQAFAIAISSLQSKISFG